MNAQCPYFIQPLPLKKINYCTGQHKLDLPRVAKKPTTSPV